jgi:uncharacterized membrane protein YdfJ with MMPL/SSD domain
VPRCLLAGAALCIGIASRRSLPPVSYSIDATIVRVLIVPSVMRILGRVNWWAPRPLALLCGRVGAAETGKVVPPPAREGV